MERPLAFRPLSEIRLARLLSKAGKIDYHQLSLSIGMITVCMVRSSILQYSCLKCKVSIVVGCQKGTVISVCFVVGLVMPVLFLFFSFSSLSFSPQNVHEISFPCIHINSPQFSRLLNPVFSLTSSSVFTGGSPEPKPDSFSLLEVDGRSDTSALNRPS